MRRVRIRKSLSSVTRVGEEISSTIPDLSRERPRRFWDPGRKLIRCLRDYQGPLRGASIIRRGKRRLAIFRHALWSAVSGADIPMTCRIGEGILLPHPNGIVIHPQATIGPNCLIFQQVTIGTGPIPGVPTIAGHVDIGPGAKILGGVIIGEHAKIGANAVVISDVPARSTAVGVPARIIKHGRP